MLRILILLVTALALTSCINLPPAESGTSLGGAPVISVKPVGAATITENGAQPTETAQPAAEVQPVAETIDVSTMAGAGETGQVHWQVHVLKIDGQCQYTVYHYTKMRKYSFEAGKVPTPMEVYGVVEGLEDGTIQGEPLQSKG
jgi:hypothetical protein